MPKFVPIAAVLTGLWSAAASSAWAENWPSWRGPTQNGVCTETDLPAEWALGRNVAWRLKLPGPAGATPVIWGERIFLTSVDEAELVLLCIGTDGRQQWRQVVSRGNRDVRGDEGNSASPSPVTDGKHVWAMMANGALACYTVQGREVWKLDIDKSYGPLKIAFGMTSTPVLFGGRLYLQLIHGEGSAVTSEALVVALDAATGAPVWKSPRVTGAHSENEHSYASPMLYNFGDLRFLITHGADYTIAYNLEDGTERWRLGGLNPHDNPARDYHPTLRFVASPAAAEGIIVAPTAKNGPVFAIRPDGHGDITGQESLHWWIRPDNTPDVPSPLIHAGLVYLCRENGDLLCLEAETGKEVYLERTHRIRHRASPVYADGKIYLVGRDGKVSVVKAGRTFELLAQNELGEDMSASLAISNGTIYLRTFESLWAVRGK